MKIETKYKLGDKLWDYTIHDDGTFEIKPPIIVEKICIQEFDKPMIGFMLMAGLTASVSFDKLKFPKYEVIYCTLDGSQIFEYDAYKRRKDAIAAAKRELEIMNDPDYKDHYLDYYIAKINGEKL